MCYMEFRIEMNPTRMKGIPFFFFFFYPGVELFFRRAPPAVLLPQ